MYSIILGIFINIIIFLIIIYGSHCIWTYLIETYSTKKTKDLVNTQVNKYKKIINELQENKSEQIINEIESMDDILTNFMQNELQ